MLRSKSTFSLSSFTFIKRLFSSSSLSAIRVVSSAYLRLLLKYLSIYKYSLSPRTAPSLVASLHPLCFLRQLCPYYPGPLLINCHSPWIKPGSASIPQGGFPCAYSLNGTPTVPSAISCHPSSHPRQSIRTDQALKVGINASLKKESPMDAERVRGRAWNALQWKRTAGETSFTWCGSCPAPVPLRRRCSPSPS